MKAKPTSQAIIRHSSDAERREQALCADALSSGEFDAMSDDEWVLLCERAARTAENGEYAVGLALNGEAG